MRRGTLCASLLVSLALFVVCLQSAFAQPPDLLRSYQFIPRLSTLHQTGGFAGFDFRMPIFGTYDFITGFQSYDGPLPYLKPYAQFANVDAEVDHPHYPDPVSIDRFLNLTGLDGEPVYYGPHGLTVFKFTGDDGSGEFAPQVTLHVATLGRWMFLRGGTHPPCCDFFQYDIKAISRQLPYGDFDGDGDVGQTDLATWHTGLDMEANSLNGRDFLIWQRSYGETAPSISEFEAMLDAALIANGTASVTEVPEPASLVLLVGFVIVLGGRSRARLSSSLEFTL